MKKNYLYDLEKFRYFVHVFLQE